jgi:hypothetical protein
MKTSWMMTFKNNYLDQQPYYPLEIINQPGLILQYGQQQLSASQEMIYTPPPPAHHITHCVLLPLQPQ